jgi:hypothetical protein
VIVNPGQSAGPKPPVAWTPNAFARLPVRRFRVLIQYRKEEEMKLHLFFILIDILILLVYPFIFVASKVRKLFNFKR